MIEVSRVEVHAALAEPNRLAVVDALALGDLSPTELSERTGQPSNLLAHHLRTLEDAGVIRRRRSDHDGRRSYVTLAWDNPVVAATAADGVAPGGARVVFVCSANSARSQFAASQLAARTPLPVASAGTEPAAGIHPLALATLRAHGLAPLTGAPASAAEVLRDDDVVIAVCDHAYEELGATRVDLHWSLPDPAAGGPEDFSRAFDALTPRVARLADALTNG